MNSLRESKAVTVVRIRLGVLLVMLNLVALPVFAIDTGPAFEDPETQARYQRLIAEIRCLTCQNQTIKDSNSLLAQDLRREVREQIKAGATDEEIATFMVERYGDFALYRTPMNERTWPIWVVPPVLFIAALLFFFSVIRKRSKLPIESEDVL